MLPLHNPIGVAEDWAVVDNLSNGRVGLSFASGWHANDFALAPENFERRRELMVEGIETVRALWRGESVSVRSGDGRPIDVTMFPPPVQTRAEDLDHRGRQSGDVRDGRPDGGEHPHQPARDEPTTTWSPTSPPTARPTARPGTPEMVTSRSCCTPSSGATSTR